MLIQRFVSAATLAVSLCTVPAFAQTPQNTAPQVTSQTDAAAKTYPVDQIVTLTVHEAWEMSGKNEAAFFDIVEQLAQFSAQKRGITLPDTAAAGRRMGLYIKTHAKADHDQLLYAVVDQAVRNLAPHAASANGSAPATR